MRLSWREAGVISLAHSAFYGMGAYTVALSTKALSKGDLLIPLFPNFIACLLLGIIITCILAALSGLMLFRIKGDYFVMLTLTFAEMIRNILASSSVFGGNLGIRAIPSVTLNNVILTQGFPSVVFCLIALIFVYVFSVRITNSRFGLSLRVVRDDEVVADITGHKPYSLRWKSFILSAAIASLAGGIASPYYGYIDPSFFGINETFFILACTALATTDHPISTIISACFLIFLTFGIAWLPISADIVGATRQLLIGFVMIIVVVTRHNSFFNMPSLNKN
jgi:branched-chain amino acid transport system permease protein